MHCPVFWSAGANRRPAPVFFLDFKLILKHFPERRTFDPA
jgi:hypothetical protein